MRLHRQARGGVALRAALALSGALAPFAALLSGTVVWAGSDDDLTVRTLAASCAACHGTDGHAVPGGAMPPLAGLSQEYILQQMQAYRDGTRTAPLMQQIARGFDATQTAALAAYFARQRAAP